MSITQDLYQKNAAKLTSEFELGSVMALPRFDKVVVNVGIGKMAPNLVENLTKDLAKLTGQRPVVTKAKKAISGFKLQKGQSVGLKVTLRKARMYGFIDRLINAVLPAIRDFKGIAIKNIDQNGNLNIGISEHSLFPEIGFETSNPSQGLQITVVTTTKKRDLAIALYRAVGFPLKEPQKPRIEEGK